ncbi:MAG: acylphosphatase [Acidimicrobiales bacterium]|nr:acylphosphatase [Acidimicrobiales bacterium]
MIVRTHMVVTGRVQGVGFRISCSRKAKSLGVAGSVSNRADGSVEVVAEGEQDAVEALQEWCQTGPPFAQVSAVECTSEPPVGDSDFRIT